MDETQFSIFNKRQVRNNSPAGCFGLWSTGKKWIVERLYGANTAEGYYRIISFEK